jgi:hypothetical protein
MECLGDDTTLECPRGDDETKNFELLGDDELRMIIDILDVADAHSLSLITRSSLAGVRKLARERADDLAAMHPLVPFLERVYPDEKKRVRLLAIGRASAARAQTPAFLEDMRMGRWPKRLAVEGDDAVAAAVALSRTWRFGDPLASSVTTMIARLNGETAFHIKPHSSRQTNVILAEHGPPFVRECGVGRQLVVVARRNVTLMEMAVRAMECPHVTRVHGPLFECVDSADSLLDVVSLWRGSEPTDMRNKNGMAAHCASHAGGYQLFVVLSTERDIRSNLNAIRLIQRYGNSLVSLVSRLLARMTDDAALAHVIFCSAHRSKGLDWPSVYVCDDFMAGGLTPAAAHALGRSRLTTLAPNVLTSELSAVQWKSIFAVLGFCLEDELNILYVALTRAKHVLYESSTTHMWHISLYKQ